MPELGPTPETTSGPERSLEVDHARCVRAPLALERSHLAWGVVRTSPERQPAERGTAVPG